MQDRMSRQIAFFLLAFQNPAPAFRGYVEDIQSNRLTSFPRRARIPRSLAFDRIPPKVLVTIHNLGASMTQPRTTSGRPFTFKLKT